jgi:RNA polymerase sigma-70 factor (ECF subfamily)
VKDPVREPRHPGEAAWVATIVRARDLGDPAPFQEVVDRFGGRVLAVARGLVGDRTAAEDVAQETFLKVYRALHTFSGSSGLYTWIYRITVNAAHDHNKRERRRRTVPLSVLTSQEEGIDLPDPDERSLAVEQQERVDAVHRALTSLPAHFRDILVLRELEGLSYEEIGAVLDLKKGTVESRLFRARHALRQAAERLHLEALL